MISSEDVRHVTFDKAFQGYRREDVDDYLKQVAQAMDDLAAQNDDLQKKLVMLAQRIEKYRTMENSPEYVDDQRPAHGGQYYPRVQAESGGDHPLGQHQGGGPRAARPR